MGSTRNIEVRRATAADVDAIADAHRDSIQSIGPLFYSLDDVAHWQDGISATLYLDAMEGGEVFFVAVAPIEGVQVALGFSSDYPIEGTTHGTSVYVRGSAVRRGIGTALLRTAEAHAAENGSERIEIAASLAGVKFYKANGYIEMRRGEAQLTSGHHIACVFMRKDVIFSAGGEPVRHL
jgi:GNAT superfamily N-acetyltransferase